MALIERVAGKPAGEAVRAPFALGRRGDLYQLFEESGASSIDIVTHTGKHTFQASGPWSKLSCGGLPVMGMHLTDKRIDQV